MTNPCRSCDLGTQSKLNSKQCAACEKRLLYLSKICEPIFTTHDYNEHTEFTIMRGGEL